MTKESAENRRPSWISSQLVIWIVSAAIPLFSLTDHILRDLPLHGMLAHIREPGTWLLFLGAGSAVALLVVQPESARKSLGNAATVLPAILALGIMAGGYVIYSGFNSRGGFYRQAALCAIGTILLGEVWIVNESVNRRCEIETRSTTAAGL